MPTEDVQDSLVLNLSPVKCDEVSGVKEPQSLKALKENFYIYTGHGIDMQGIIDQALGDLCNTPDISKYIIRELELLFADNQCAALSENSNVDENIKAYMKLLDTVKVAGNKYENCDIFKMEEIKNVAEEVASSNLTLLHTTHETNLLDFVKCIEIGKVLNNAYPNSLHVIFNDQTVIKNWLKANVTKTYHTHKKIFICIERNIQIQKYTQYLNVNTKEHFLILSYTDVLTGLFPRYLEHPYSDISKEISEKGYKLVREYPVEYQGHIVKMQDVCKDFVIENKCNTIIDEIISNQKVTIGKSLPAIDPFFIERSYAHGTMEIKGTDFATHCLSRKITIISDVAGMGKSTSLTYICNQIKMLHTNYWVQFIELKLHIKELATIEENVSTDAALSILSKLVELNDTESKIFYYICREMCNVVLLFDGFDEISPQAEKAFQHLIKVLSQTNIKSLIVSTRPNYASVLETATNVTSTNIIGFTTKDQKEFLTKYWTNNVREQNIDSTILENIVQHVVSEIEKNSKVLNEIAGIPLQTRMIADIYFNDVKQYVNESKMDKMNIKIDLFNLYERFIALHIDRCMIEKYKLENLESSIYNRIKSDTFKAESGIWEAVACKEILPVLQVAVQYQAADIKAMCDVGIVAKLDPHTFMHRTFAEFLAAKYVANIMHEGCDETTLRFIFDDILSYGQYVVFRKFLNSILMNMQQWKECNANCHAAHKNAIKVYESIIKNINDSPIYVAAADGNTEILQFLLRHGADINCRNEYGATPIYWAAWYGHTDTVKCLAQHGADINCGTESGTTPIHWAAWWGHTDTVKCLAQHGADINCRDEDGWTPIHGAAGEGRTDTVKCLAQHGADINATNNKGQTPAAVARRRYDMYGDSKYIATATYLESLMSGQSKQ
jgi:hypothetical protein